MRGVAKIARVLDSSDAAAARLGDTLKKAQLRERTDPEVHTLGEPAPAGRPPGPLRRGHWLRQYKDEEGALNQ
jgi:hypothetical protein